MNEIQSVPVEGDLSPDMIRKLSLSASQMNSELDPGGKIFLKTLAELKQNHKLPPVEYVWEKVAQMCYFEMKTSVERGDFRPEEIRVPIRIHEWIMTKKNRVRLVPGDHSSPMGVVIKNDRYFIEQHSPYACAWFLAHEVFRFAIDRLPEQPAWLPSLNPTE